MGMFDYVKVEENSLGIPAGNYQTKALECYCDEYLINKDLEIIHVSSSFVRNLPKKETFSKPIRLLNRDTGENVYVKVYNGVVEKVLTEEEYKFVYNC